MPCEQCGRTHVGPCVQPKRRFNAFFADRSENENVTSVVYQQAVPTSSAGWSHSALFENLGDPRNSGLARNAEQEYLLMNMVKDAMAEASEIATRYGVGIAVRGTGLLAHMAIESGMPTKAQEIKNKTSKDLDLFLCDELSWGDVGAVMHYDPRVGWSSSLGGRWRTTPEATEEEWQRKKRHIQTVRIPKLRGQLGGRLKFPETEADWQPIRSLFMDRVREYHEEDREFRHGHYSAHVVIAGPFVRLKVRPDDNLYGDHDLFCFTRGAYGAIAGEPSSDVFQSLHRANLYLVQGALQGANVFQAQHGGIWYWQPSEAFHVKIKAKIMGAHSPPKGEPLVYIRPNGEVTAAFFVPGDARAGIADRLVSVWDWFPVATQWLKTTYSGKQLLTRCGLT